MESPPNASNVMRPTMMETLVYAEESEKPTARLLLIELVEVLRPLGPLTLIKVAPEAGAARRTPIKSEAAG
jgi:hypothetical protein